MVSNQVKWQVFTCVFVVLLFPTPLLGCFPVPVCWCVVTDILVFGPHFLWKPINRVDSCLPTELEILHKLLGRETATLPERLHISQALGKKLASLAEQAHGSHRAWHWRWRGQRQGRLGRHSWGRGQAHHSHRACHWIGSQVHGSYGACHQRVTGRRGQRRHLECRWGGWRGDRVQWGVRGAGYYLLLTQTQGLHWQIIVVCVIKGLNGGGGRPVIFHFLCQKVLGDLACVIPAHFDWIVLHFSHSCCCRCCEVHTRCQWW